MRKECKYCGELRLKKTDWRPYVGMNFRLRQFFCRRCHYFTYILITYGELEKEKYDEAVERLKAEVQAEMKLKKERLEDG